MSAQPSRLDGPLTITESGRVLVQSPHGTTPIGSITGSGSDGWRHSLGGVNHSTPIAAAQALRSAVKAAGLRPEVVGR